MEMSRYFICCNQCFETIGRRNTNAARLWMDFCAAKLKCGEIIELEMSDFPELRVLENLGFVVSTDRQNTIAIRVNGHMSNQDGEHFFCVKEGQHG